jgi:hypothetical protein
MQMKETRQENINLGIGGQVEAQERTPLCSGLAIPFIQVWDPPIALRQAIPVIAR